MMVNYTVHSKQMLWCCGSEHHHYFFSIKTTDHEKASHTLFFMRKTLQPLKNAATTRPKRPERKQPIVSTVIDWESHPKQ